MFISRAASRIVKSFLEQMIIIGFVFSSYWSTPWMRIESKFFIFFCYNLPEEMKLQFLILQQAAVQTSSESADAHYKFQNNKRQSKHRYSRRLHSHRLEVTSSCGKRVKINLINCLKIYNKEDFNNIFLPNFHFVYYSTLGEHFSSLVRSNMTAIS